MIYNFGDFYIGYWKNDKINGEGTYEFKNGYIYKGNFTSGLKDGYGEYTAPPPIEITYKGNWKNGFISGNGEFLYLDGSKYIGEFENGKKEGFGEMFMKSGCHYRGHWKNDFKYGYGENVDYDNTIYKGNWLEDYKHGYGEVIYADNTVYKGNFRKGMTSGIGEYIFHGAGGVIKGVFHENIFSGKIEHWVSDACKIDIDVTNMNLECILKLDQGKIEIVEDNLKDYCYFITQRKFS